MNFADKEEDLLDINITPLIDIVFLLLIFFMISTTFVNDNAIDVQLPQASSAKSSSTEQATTVGVSAEGNIYIDGKATSLDKLKAQLSSSKEVTIKADKTASHGQVVKVLDIAKEAGVKSLNIAAEKK